MAVHEITDEMKMQLQYYLYQTTAKIARTQKREYSFTESDLKNLPLWQHLPWNYVVQGVKDNYAYSGVTVKTPFLDIGKKLELKW